MDTNTIGEIAKGGFGYVLFIGALAVIFYLYKEVKQLQQEKFDFAQKQTMDYLNMANKTIDTLSTVQSLLNTLISKNP